MSQRWSEYKRQKNESYETPAWVTEALVPFLPNSLLTILDPAAGSGKIVRALIKCGYAAVGTDIARKRDGVDFLKTDGDTEAVVTNPPYNQAAEFILHALAVTRKENGFVAMLLRTDFDHAQTRVHLFRHEAFSKKIVLTRRIVWFERKGAAPSFNHAWFLWDWYHRGPPTIAYV